MSCDWRDDLRVVRCASTLGGKEWAALRAGIHGGDGAPPSEVDLRVAMSRDGGTTSVSSDSCGGAAAPLLEEWAALRAGIFGGDGAPPSGVDVRAAVSRDGGTTSVSSDSCGGAAAPLLEEWAALRAGIHGGDGLQLVEPTARREHRPPGSICAWRCRGIGGTTAVSSDSCGALDSHDEGVIL
jgi:hypothetical protein